MNPYLNLSGPFAAIALAFSDGQKSVESFKRTIAMLNEPGSFYEDQKKHYLLFHKRLPGSERTARLRKKRYDRVVNFYWTGK